MSGPLLKFDDQWHEFSMLKLRFRSLNPWPWNTINWWIFSVMCIHGDWYFFLSLLPEWRISHIQIYKQTPSFLEGLFSFCKNTNLNLNWLFFLIISGKINSLTLPHLSIQNEEAGNLLAPCGFPPFPSFLDGGRYWLPTAITAGNPIRFGDNLDLSCFRSDQMIFSELC